MHRETGARGYATRDAKARCANHHQKHTIQQFGYKKWLVED